MPYLIIKTSPKCGLARSFRCLPGGGKDGAGQAIFTQSVAGASSTLGRPPTGHRSSWADSIRSDLSQGCRPTTAFNSGANDSPRTIATSGTVVGLLLHCGLPCFVRSPLPSHQFSQHATEDPEHEKQCGTVAERTRELTQHMPS